jgi:hypothetical protein
MGGGMGGGMGGHHGSMSGSESGEPEGRGSTSKPAPLKVKEKLQLARAPASR